jgi:hypothetical protein
MMEVYRVENKLQITNHPSLFDSSNFKPYNTKLFINKSKILSLTEKLKSEQSLSSLKKSVFEFKNIDKFVLFEGRAND